MQILAPISLGELIDKITILELKQEYITDELKLQNINHELSELNKILSNLLIKTPLNNEREALKEVNRDLWHIENFKRECEGNGRFDRAFIEAGREVYLKNDLRAQLKRRINTLTGSSIIEEKSYVSNTG
jgi:hypothetical protein